MAALLLIKRKLDLLRLSCETLHPPSPNSRKALRQLCSQRCAQCMAKERAGAGGRSPQLQAGGSGNQQQGHTVTMARTRLTANINRGRCCTPGGPPSLAGL